MLQRYTNFPKPNPTMHFFVETFHKKKLPLDIVKKKTILALNVAEIQIFINFAFLKGRRIKAETKIMNHRYL